jgi:REP element-mobilizing transposase RayT
MEVGRKHPVHHHARERHNESVLLFVTVCSKDRKKIFDRPESHELLMRSWRKADAWSVGRYVVMPDHIHLFCSPEGIKRVALLDWVSYWKSLSSRAWPWLMEQPIWQRHFWDTALRCDESYDAKWDYVVQNPVRAGLVERAEEWLYQGELNVLRW